MPKKAAGGGARRCGLAIGEERAAASLGRASTRAVERGCSAQAVHDIWHRKKSAGMADMKMYESLTESAPQFFTQLLSIALDGFRATYYNNSFITYSNLSRFRVEMESSRSRIWNSNGSAN